MKDVLRHVSGLPLSPFDHAAIEESLLLKGYFVITLLGASSKHEMGGVNVT